MQTKTLDAIAMPVTSEGDFFFSCEHGLIWHTETPIRETLVYSKTGTHHRLSGENHTEILNGRLTKRMSAMLISLIENDEAALNTLFHKEPLEQSILLTPKKRKLRKFIQTIEIAKTPEEANIAITFNNNQQSQIRVYEKTDLTHMNMASCEKILIKPAACGLLFQ